MKDFDVAGNRYQLHPPGNALPAFRGIERGHEEGLHEIRFFAGVALCFALAE